MPKTDVIDVLIVGLGPAGATAAAVAARAGARVVALERKQKAGVPVQCAELVPLIIPRDAGDVRASFRQGVDNMRTFVEHEAPDLAHHFAGHMIDRATFDAEIVKQAIAAGADCRLAVNVRAIDARGSILTQTGERLSAKVIIGADGPRSSVGQAIGCENLSCAEARQITIELLSPQATTDIFLSAEFPGGYGWLFPKGSVANLGAGVASDFKLKLKGILESLHERLALQGKVGRKILRHTGGSIPVGGIVGPAGTLEDTIVLLAGDAAGLANPISGAGINSAVISGALAGDAAVSALNGNASAASDYSDEIEALFKPGLDRALRHRQRLVADYEARRPSAPNTLRETWIAYDAYWAS